MASSTDAMKIAFLSESPADEAAIRILVEAVLGERVQVMQPPLRARGWPHVGQVLPPILRHLQFQTDTDALIVVVDSDDTPLHEGDHEDPNQFHPLCRLCQLELIVRRTIRRWKLPPDRAPLRVATGLAVPAVEAWYLCGRDPEVGEAGWRRCTEKPRARKDVAYATAKAAFPQRPPHAMTGNDVAYATSLGALAGRCPYTRRELKWRTYGTYRPPLPLEIRRAQEEARRLAADLRVLENAFPLGFGNLAREVRRWRDAVRV